MIIRRETLNEISSLLAAGFTSGNIAATLRIAESDVKSAIAAWKLQEKKLDFLRIFGIFGKFAESCRIGKMAQNAENVKCFFENVAK